MASAITGTARTALTITRVRNSAAWSTAGLAGSGSAAW